MPHRGGAGVISDTSGTRQSIASDARTLPRCGERRRALLGAVPHSRSPKHRQRGAARGPDPATARPDPLLRDGARALARQAPRLRALARLHPRRPDHRGQPPQKERQRQCMLDSIKTLTPSPRSGRPNTRWSTSSGRTSRRSRRRRPPGRPVWTTGRSYPRSPTPSATRTANATTGTSTRCRSSSASSSRPSARAGPDCGPEEPGLALAGGLRPIYERQVGEDWSRSVRLGLSATRGNEANAAFLTRCGTRTRSAGLTLSHGKLSWEGYQPIFILDWSRTDSNVPLSNQEPLQLRSGLRRLFRPPRSRAPRARSQSDVR